MILNMEGIGRADTDSPSLQVFLDRTVHDAASYILFSSPWARCRLVLGVHLDLGSERLSKSVHPRCGLCRIRRSNVVIIALPSTEVYDSLLQSAHCMVATGNEMAKFLQCGR